MHRTLPLLLCALLLFTHPARSEEAEPPPRVSDPAQVAKLLLSADEDERARGAALLRARMTQGGDVQTWLVAMARAQAEWADADERLVERWIADVLRGAPERAVRARRLLAALGRDATRRLLLALKEVQTLLPQAAGQTRSQGAALPQPTVPAPSAEAQNDTPPPPPQAPAPQAPVRVVAAPVGRVQAVVLEIPQAEILASLAAEGDAYGKRVDELSPLVHEQAVVVKARPHDVFARARALPEARVRPVDPVQGFLVPGRDLVMIQGDAIRYRNRVRRTKGAWAVETDTLRRGLQLRVRLEAEQLEIEARYTRMPDPLPTEQVRPAGNVEPIELDRPEWETASLTLTTSVAAARDEVVAFFPGLIPDKMVVVSLRLLPVTGPSPAQEPSK